MFFVSFCLCGAMSLSVYIYENVFCLLLFFGFLFLYSTLGNNGCIMLCYRNKINEIIYLSIISVFAQVPLLYIHKDLCPYFKGVRSKTLTSKEEAFD